MKDVFTSLTSQDGRDHKKPIELEGGRVMEGLPATERSGPDIRGEGEVLVRRMAHRLKQMIETDREAPTLSRQRVLRFCEAAQMLQELASGDPTRVNEYLGTH